MAGACMKMDDVPLPSNRAVITPVVQDIDTLIIYKMPAEKKIESKPGKMFKEFECQYPSIDSNVTGERQPLLFPDSFHDVIAWTDAFVDCIASLTVSQERSKFEQSIKKLRKTFAITEASLATLCEDVETANAKTASAKLIEDKEPREAKEASVQKKSRKHAKDAHGSGRRNKKFTPRITALDEEQKLSKVERKARTVVRKDDIEKSNNRDSEVQKQLDDTSTKHAGSERSVVDAKNEIASLPAEILSAQGTIDATSQELKFATATVASLNTHTRFDKANESLNKIGTSLQKAHEDKVTADEMEKAKAVCDIKTERETNTIDLEDFTLASSIDANELIALRQSTS
ncbi:hypothetical protein K504DRAFT_531656 [Pleomassaria siparia CBS 279.74]|uniref:Uncharacterized protein n=1 Tax=Pleomassaria siparia CBS 279.74 TaxID=1314801 RepID=A0A6G1KJP7_9PLEO|nr:hypothetical protein K504DRAFT_531656 [Pleomassaria siparia CBS 279.74]